jgi:hypothetical protein
LDFTALVAVMVKFPGAFSELVAMGSHWFKGCVTFVLINV